MSRPPRPLDLERSSDGVPPVVVQVRGEAALFSRPELKAERVTYPVMTPTAARGVLEAIFWKPQMLYRVLAIEVLNPVRQFTVRRNETHHVVSLDGALKGERVDSSARRDQRNAVCLREVAYRIHAHIEVKPGAKHNAAAYRDQFRRRVTRGACFHQPFLGTKEFSADFGDPDDSPPIALSEDLGLMIHTIHHGPPVVMEWFTARLEGGVLHVPRHGLPAPVELVGR
ncbi:type I-C CRISPR-associated protein Cas5c [Nonomuraea longicatena]|uniref:pre-crRNA processing endonuclease n=1 Tax=Nonomuraea longicatena TaxID=83682 RepID=A0ABN1NWJ3_9ACTN